MLQAESTGLLGLGRVGRVVRRHRGAGAGRRAPPLQVAGAVELQATLSTPHHKLSTPFCDTRAVRVRVRVQATVVSIEERILLVWLVVRSVRWRQAKTDGFLNSYI